MVPEGVGPVDGLPQNGEVVLCVEDHRKPCGEQGFVVGEPDRDHARAQGRFAETRHPPVAGSGPAVSMPPEARTRSRMPVIP